VFSAVSCVRGRCYSGNANGIAQLWISQCPSLLPGCCASRVVITVLLLRLMASGYCANMLLMVLKGIDRCESKCSGTPFQGYAQAVATELWRFIDGILFAQMG